jgi:hypothetical protein
MPYRRDDSAWNEESMQVNAHRFVTAGINMQFPSDNEGCCRYRDAANGRH